MATKRKSTKPTPQEPLKLKDGRVVFDLPKHEQAKVWLNHIDPEHDDYNPAGRTRVATDIKGREATLEAIFKEGEKKANLDGGRPKGGETIKSRAEARRALWLASAKKIKREKPGLSIPDLARKVELEFNFKSDAEGGGCTLRTIRDYLNKAKATDGLQ